MDNDLRDKRQLVDEAIDDFYSKLAGDNQKNDRGKIKDQIREIILDNDSWRTDKQAEALVKILSENTGGVDTDTIVRAKGVSLGIKEWVGKNRETVSTFRGEELERRLVEETKRMNPEMVDEQIKTVRRLAQNINRLYHSGGGIENQKDKVLKEFDTESPGKVKNAWNDTQGIVGILRQKPQELEKIKQEHQQITENLKDIILPYQQNDKLASYDRVINSSKNLEMGRFLNSVRNSVSFNRNPITFIKGTMERLLGGGSVGSEGSAGPGIKITSRATGGLENLASNGASFLKKSAGDLASKLGVGAKNFLGKSFDKIGGSLIKGLNAAASTSIKSTGLLGAKVIAPIIIVFFVVFFLGSMMQMSNISGLVPRLEEGDEVDREGEKNNQSFKHDPITYIEDGRIKSCGVGMEVDFKRNGNKPIVTPEVLVKDLYNKQLEDFVGDQLGTACGVVYAAQYLAYDFDYWVPYFFAGKYPQKGLNPDWGKPGDDGKDHYFNGLDCGHFRTWAWINGGYNGNPGNAVPNIPFGDCEKIKSVIEPGDGLYTPKPGDTEEGSSHSAIVLAYDNNEIKFAHAGDKSGVTTGKINICTGEGTDNGNSFEFLQKKKY